MNHAENKNIWSKMKEKLHKYSFLGCLLLAGIVFFTWTDNWQVYTEPLQETYTKGVLLAEQLVEGKWPGISGEQSDATGSVSGNVPGENVKTGDTVSDGNQTDQTMGTVQSPATGEEAAMPETTGTETQDPAATVPVEEIPQEVVYHTVDDSYFDDAVFIGDSRTVGMYEYGGLEETSTFYASTGLTVYKMFDSAIVSVPGQKKKITVEEANAKLKEAGANFSLDPNKNPGGGWTKEEMEEGFIPAPVETPWWASMHTFAGAVAWQEEIDKYIPEKDMVYNRPKYHGQNVVKGALRYLYAEDGTCKYQPKSMADYDKDHGRT